VPVLRARRAAVEELKTRYGPHLLRVVWVNDPLPFHDHARSAAIAAEAVHELGGVERFFRFVTLIFRDQEHLAPENLRRVALAVGVDGASYDVLTRSTSVAERIDMDVAAAGHAGVNGTPHFLVNGIAVTGAVPVADLVAVIEPELNEARALMSRGTPAKSVYAMRAKTNFAAPAPSADEAAPVEKPMNVPVGTSPREGPDDALVTIIEFSDYQCPYCKKIQDTLRAVAKSTARTSASSGSRCPSLFTRTRAPLRPSRSRRARRSGRGFLEGLGSALREFSIARADGSLGARRQARPFVAEDRPGHRHGRGPHDAPRRRGGRCRFRRARTLISSSMVNVWWARSRSRRSPPSSTRSSKKQRSSSRAGSRGQGLRRGDAHRRTRSSAGAPRRAAATAANPSRGPRDAPIVIQMFADFECPFCRRAMTTIDELEQRHPKQIRLVYRNMPLEFHPGARLAAAAALDAFEQRGDDAFWKMAALLDADQDDPAPLKREDVIAHGKALGLDVVRLGRAIDGGGHDRAIDADVTLASTLGIKGTPAFILNGYYIAGAQPLAVFERAVQRALADAASRGAVRAR